MSDLINRQAVIDSFEIYAEAYAEMLRIVLDNTDIVGNEREKFAWGLELIESLISDMKELPSAELRKKGKWIDNTFCSECGWIHEVESGFIGSVNQFNFCPNCGADMRGGQNDTD